MSSNNFGMGAVISIRQLNDVAVLDISGRLTLGPALNQLSDAIKSFLETGVRKFVLNLAEVTYIDSSGIGELTGAYKDITQKEGRLKLAAVPKRVQDLLKMIGAHSLFDFQMDEAAALRSYSLSV